ncbi:hypothetical protein [Caudoviricetes sp.]|nr:hypothetical protein [Caudoviricetes sp.]
MKMKKKLLEMVVALQEEGHDLKETPALFTWSYPEEPYIKFQMLIKETTNASLPLETTLH